jgi:hypothetical protein
MFRHKPHRKYHFYCYSPIIHRPLLAYPLSWKPISPTNFLAIARVLLTCFCRSLPSNTFYFSRSLHSNGTTRYNIICKNLDEYYVLVNKRLKCFKFKNENRKSFLCAHTRTYCKGERRGKTFSKLKRCH